MSAHSRVVDLIEIILSTVAQEAGKTQDQLSVEVESVVTRGVLEAFKRGEEHAHERPTEPPMPRQPTPRPLPAVRPVTPAPFPVPRRKKRDRRED